MQDICDCSLTLYRQIEEKLCLSYKEYLNDHRCERTNMTSRCKMLRVSPNTLFAFAKIKKSVKHEYLIYHSCERANISTKS